MDYNFPVIEEKWQKRWKENKTFKVENSSSKPKFYVLDMFPYPSGAGLHVGHPLGYIASDIYTRYKRLEGFNVLHPMGFDAFGLPAEQYAIQTGQHPAVTTDTNIKRYKEQLEKIGFAYDWDREVRTCDPSYYKWTQWVFVKLFNHFYNNETKKAEPIEKLISEFEINGNQKIDTANHCEVIFSASEWKQKSEKEQQEILLCYRLAFLAETLTNWCPALGTVLANDEIKDGFSVRGGHPVEQRKMKQWCLRITAYSERLLNGLDNLEWTESLKEMQRNWIGRSEGALIKFKVESLKSKDEDCEIFVFTTRPDTIYGCTFMVLAPEHELVPELTTPEQKAEVEKYIEFTKKRTERERMTEVNRVSGCFTGSYALNPFTNQQIPIWISEYVLIGYGTGAIMAVPAHDSRDFAFARYFNLPVPQVIMKEGETPSDTNTWTESYDAKDGVCINSGFINGMSVQEGSKTMINKIEETGIGKRMVNYRLRDAIFSRQRYWGEPFPIYYKDGIPYSLEENKLPLELPEIETFLPTEDRQPPLGRAKNWKTPEGYPYETSTMPGFAGSSGYYFRYMDPKNNNEYFSKDIVNYWQDVDLYIGGTEHATGHLIYARFWCKFLYDLGMVPKEEPFKKLINQGMIQGRSNFVYRVKSTNTFVSANKLQWEFNIENGKFEYEPLNQLYNKYGNHILTGEFTFSENSKLIKRYKKLDYTVLHVDVNIVENDILDEDAFKRWMPEFENAEFIHDEDEKYRCGYGIEKMSKSMYNVVNPDTIVEKYGADTLRMYEMFLGPLEQSKPWDTNGIEGVHRFFRKFWKLYHNDKNVFSVTDEQPNNAELKVLHKLIKKVKEDIEGFSFNTSVSAFMICVNELNDLKCNKKAILEPLAIILSPFAPHIAEEMWELLGHKESILNADYPAFNENYLKENTKSYPVSFNGRVRFQLELPLDIDASAIEKAAMENEQTTKWLEGKAPKKVIVVPGKIINIVS